MRIRADELSGKHMGHTITIRRDDADITGILAGIGHQADLITSQALCQPIPSITAGRITYTITIGTMTLTMTPDELVIIDGHDDVTFEQFTQAFKRNI